MCTLYKYTQRLIFSDAHRSDVMKMGKDAYVMYTNIDYRSRFSHYCESEASYKMALSISEMSSSIKQIIRFPRNNSIMIVSTGKTTAPISNIVCVILTKNQAKIAQFKRSDVKLATLRKSSIPECHVFH